jgi:hypothetical protein
MTEHEIKIEELAKKIELLIKYHNVWSDVRIYYNGKAVCSNDGFIPEINVKDYLEYGNPDTISMSFEGPLYEVINYTGGRFLDDFNDIIKSYGYYYEQGHAWNLALFEN